MDLLGHDVIGHVGNFMDLASRKACLEAAQCFSAINHEYTYHFLEINDDNVEERLPSLGNTLKYIKSIKPSCKNLRIAFKNLMNVDAINDEYLKTLCIAAEAFETVSVDIELCSSDCIVKLLDGVRSWQCMKLNLLRLDTSTPFSDVVLRDSIHNLKTPTCGSLVLSENNLHLLKNEDLMSCIQSIYVYIHYNGINSPGSINLRNLINVKHVHIFIDDRRVVIEDGVDYITHLYLKGMIWETSSTPLLSSLSHINKMTSRMVEMQMTENNLEDVKLSHAFDNGWNAFVKIAPKHCKIIYKPFPRNSLAIDILKTLAKYRPIPEYQPIVYGYDCDDAYLLSKVFTKLVPTLIAQSMNETYKPPLHQSVLTNFRDIYIHLSLHCQLHWHWIKYLPTE